MAGMAACLYRPSSWPVRSQRRHAATAEFNSKVLTLLEDVTSRLGRIESSLANGAYRVPPGLEATILQENAHDDVDQLEERVRSMEALLFKASFQDFQVLDRIVADACAVDVSCHSGKGSAKFPTTNRTPGSNQLFNIYDDDDVTDVGAQTDQAACYEKVFRRRR